MKRVEIRNLEDLIKRLDLSKVEKETAKLIINFHLSVFREDKITTDKMNEVREMLLVGKEEEIALLTNLRTRIKVARNEEERKSLISRMDAECKGILAVEKTMQEKFDEIGEEEVIAPSATIPIDAMLSALNANGISYGVETMEILALLDR